MSWVSKLVVFLSIVHGVRGETEEGMTMLVIAGAVAFVLLIVLLSVLACVLTWDRWFPAIQRSKGKVKMPRSYWKKKKEAKQRLLLNTSRASRATASTTMPAPHQENGGALSNGNATLVNRVKDTASWVQGWNNATPRDDQPYEDLTLTMELDEEPEFRIETSVVDDETLDLGPFKSPEPQEPPAPAQQPPAEDYTYTAVAPRPHPHHHQPGAPTSAEAAAVAAVAAATRTDEQTVTMQVDDEDDDDDDDARPAAPRKSFFDTPLMGKPRQVDSSDTPEPPALPPPPPEESYSDLLKTSVVAF